MQKFGHPTKSVLSSPPLPTVKRGLGNFLPWCCVAASGTGNSTQREEIMDYTIYIISANSE